MLTTSHIYAWYRQIAQILRYGRFYLVDDKIYHHNIKTPKLALKTLKKGIYINSTIKYSRPVNIKKDRLKIGLLKLF